MEDLRNIANAGAPSRDDPVPPLEEDVVNNQCFGKNLHLWGRVI